MTPAMTETQIAQFHRDGYLVLRAMVAPEVCSEMLAVTTRDLQGAVPPLEYETEVGYPGAPASFEAEGGRTVRRLRGAYARDAVFRGWSTDANLADGLKLLLDDDVVLSLAHHNCVMTKHPHFGTATGWHRDIRYWSFARNELISVWLALGDEVAANGGLRVIPGSHLLQLAAGQLDALDFLRPDVAQNQALFAQGVPVELHAGDVLLFHSGLFHSAGVNASERIKTSVVFAYRGAGNPPVAGSKSAAAGEVSLG
jgi:phytanoyl-CoA hydroxylase